GVLCVPAVGPVLRAIHEVGNAAVGGAAGGALLCDAGKRAGRIARALIRAERRLVGSEAGLEQQAICEGVRPGELTDARVRVQILAEFRRRRGTQAAESERTHSVPGVRLLTAAVLGLGERRPVARNLFVPVHVYLVAGTRLERQAHRVEPPAFSAANVLCTIRQIQRFAGITGIQVRPDVRNRPMLSLITGRHAIPQTVLDDWPPHAESEIP